MGTKGEKAVFVDAKEKDAGYGPYFVMDTFDLEWVKGELGSSVVNMAVFKKKEPKYENTHYMKFTAADPKYLKKSDKEKYAGKAGVSSGVITDTGDVIY